jgi:murein DD-endopeptidase MepM/ murein hydrolase activator NlpD
MQKNDKFYTFLLSNTNKKGIYIRRYSVSKKGLHIGSIGGFLFVVFAALSVGMSGSVPTEVFARSTQQPTDIVKKAGVTSIDYSRPGDLAPSSGGPELADQGTEDGSVESEIRLVKAMLPPANIPNEWAHLGKINNEFGFRRNPFGGRAYEFHAGMDIDGERGHPVKAPGGGTVAKAEYRGGYGNMVEIDHGNGLTTRYGHLSKIDVAAGDIITRGQVLGAVGSTGRSTGPHLHFEFRLNDRAINPRHFLPQEPTDLTKLVR